MVAVAERSVGCVDEVETQQGPIQTKKTDPEQITVSEGATSCLILHGIVYLACTFIFLCLRSVYVSEDRAVSRFAHLVR